MINERGYVSQLAGRSAAALVMTYVLLLGGTFNGILVPSIQRFSLVLLLVIVLAWQAAVWRRPRAGLFDPLGPALVVWAAAYGIATLAHPSARVYIGVWYAGLYAGVWFLFSDLLRRGFPSRWIIDGALLTSLPIMLLAWVQVLAWYPEWLALKVHVAFVPPRPTSALGNPNVLGSVLAMLIPFGLVKIRYALRRPDRVLWVLWCVWAFVTLYMTYSRGAWLASAVSLVVLGGLIVERRHRREEEIARPARLRGSRRVILGVTLVTVTGVIVLLILVLAATSAFDTPRRATGERFTFYRIAWQMFRQHPLTGTGPFTYGLDLLAHRSIPPEQPHAHAHNLVLNVLAELGVLGGAALAVTVFLIVRQTRRVLNSQSYFSEWIYTAAAVASLAGFAAHSLVDMPLMFPAVMLLMLGILAASLVQPHGRDRRGWQSGPVTLVYRAAVAGLWAAVLVTGWWSNRIYADYVAGEEQLVAGAYGTGAEILQQVVETRPDFPLYQALYGYACGLAAYHGDTTCLAAGIRAYQRALDLEAPHAVWWANLGALYWQAGQGELAVQAMQQAVRYAPDAPDFWLNLGQFAEQMGQTQLATDAYREVLTRDPSWGQTSFWGGTALRQDVLRANPVEPTRYARAEALWQAGDRAGATALLDEAIRHDPSQPGPYIRLARLWLQAGDLARAQDYLDAADVLVHANLDRAWIALVEAEMAQAVGDQAGWRLHRQQARQWLWPDATGFPLFYGLDVAQYQFLHVQTQGVLLPQLTIYDPDPQLVDLLR